MSRDEAAATLGATGLWQADHYLLPGPATTRPVTDIDIHHLAPQLRFSGDSDHLTLEEDGRMNGQQLQRLRVLAGNSPQLLADAMEALNAGTLAPGTEGASDA